MVKSFRSHYSLNTVISRFFIANTLALFGIFGGLVPEFRWQPATVVLRQVAHSQEFSADKINRYAKAVLQIETERKKAFQTIQDMIGRVPPKLICTNKNSIRKLPRKAQKVAVDFCNNSKKIAKDSGLSAQEFNQITEKARQDAAFKRQVQRAIIRARQ